MLLELSEQIGMGIEFLGMGVGPYRGNRGGTSNAVGSLFKENCSTPAAVGEVCSLVGGQLHVSFSLGLSRSHGFLTPAPVKEFSTFGLLLCPLMFSMEDAAGTVAAGSITNISAFGRSAEAG